VPSKGLLGLAGLMKGGGDMGERAARIRGYALAAILGAVAGAIAVAIAARVVPRVMSQAMSEMSRTMMARMQEAGVSPGDI
jgi:outer membrane lipoprotein SlyB